MTRALTLEEFSTDPASPPGPTAPAAAADPETALAAFDEGYRNGWEDCASAEAEGQRRIGADLARALSEVNRSYEQARADILAALGPLFEEMAARLLPRLAAEAVAPAVQAELTRIADQASGGQVVLMAAPAALPALERLVDTQPDLSLRLVAEPALAEGQVSLRFAGERRDIDLGEAADRMAEALRAFTAPDQTGAPRAATQGAA
ncbi:MULTISPECIES: flagellar biosynthesis protein [Roseicyclus]|uniref:flagellar biosynthesis protein n=1 Tax=Roseicyclus amphidinii TaxID=3034232 RepID=UPI0024E07684|nr:flagellar biosynthesis protein [Roseicyclus sp. Amp-Y-6]